MCAVLGLLELVCRSNAKTVRNFGPEKLLNTMRREFGRTESQEKWERVETRSWCFWGCKDSVGNWSRDTLSVYLGIESGFIMINDELGELE